MEMSQKSGEEEFPALRVAPAPKNGDDLSTKLFRRLKKEGVTAKRQGDLVLSEAGEVPEELRPPPIDDDAPPAGGKPKFHAGKRVVESSSPSLSPRVPRQRPRPSLKESVNPGWPMILRMMEDIGWDLVLGRVRTFVDNLSLTEVAQKFQPPPDALVETILASWRSAGIHKNKLVDGRLKTVPEVATALVVYVTEFQQGK